MNFLAHIYLARYSDDAMLGALLGDFIGTAELDRYNAVMRREILLHWKVDSYTDHHPSVLAARTLFPQGRRRFAGILLDVYFDHLLARDWPRYSDVPLDQFTAHFYRVMLAQLPHLTADLQRVAPRIAAHDWLGSYHLRDNVDLATRRIATRLSRHGDKLVECLPILRANEASVAEHFEVFFPQLIDYVEATRSALPGPDIGAVLR